MHVDKMDQYTLAVYIVGELALWTDSNRTLVFPNSSLSARKVKYGSVFVVPIIPHHCPTTQSRDTGEPIVIQRDAAKRKRPPFGMRGISFS